MKHKITTGLLIIAFACLCGAFFKLNMLYGKLLKTSQNEIKSIIYTPLLEVTCTTYHAVEEECDKDFLVTASGKEICNTDNAYSHRYIAVSRDLLSIFPYGTAVQIYGSGDLDGEYIVADTMHKRFSKRVDVLINPGMKGGKWERVIIRKK